MGDWDRKAKEPASVWLKLKAKDASIRIRIAAAPFREAQVWPSEPGGRPVDREVVNDFTPGQWMSIMRSTDWQISEAYHLLVIDRADGLAKIFTTSAAVYTKIRELAQNEEWGNPMGYDITITRTEKPGSYWEILPSPAKSDLMSSERALAEQLVDKLPAGALPASSNQPDDIPENTPPERLPWESAPASTSVATAPIEPPAADPPPYEEPPVPKGKEDIVIEDIGDEPINLDDIPFSEDPSKSQKGTPKAGK